MTEGAAQQAEEAFVVKKDGIQAALVVDKPELLPLEINGCAAQVVGILLSVVVHSVVHFASSDTHQMGASIRKEMAAGCRACGGH